MSRLESLKIKAKLLQKAKKKAGKVVALKDAYNIIAKSAGYGSWREMKKSVDQHSDFFPSGAGLPYWNNWYGSYEEAKKFHKPGEEYLIPYEKQFFLCGTDYIVSVRISVG